MRCMLPAIERSWFGVVVPMPTLPEARMVKSDAPDDEATENGLVLLAPRMVRVEVPVEVPSAKVPSAKESAVEMKRRPPSTPIVWI